MPDSITLLPPPSCSPELDPLRNIWQFLRDNWFSNRVFRSYDDIAVHCCEAWNVSMGSSQSRRLVLMSVPAVGCGKARNKGCDSISVQACYAPMTSRARSRSRLARPYI